MRCDAEIEKRSDSIIAALIGAWVTVGLAVERFCKCRRFVKMLDLSD